MNAARTARDCHASASERLSAPALRPRPGQLPAGTGGFTSRTTASPRAGGIFRPRRYLAVLILAAALGSGGGVAAATTGSGKAAPQPLFDGTSLAGWEGATGTVWRLRDGAIVGGSLEGNPRNEFLATTRAFTNFHLRLEYKLVGTEGFVNGGVQFRSRRIAEPAHEMAGFQADIGAGYSGCLYDESRRNRMLVMADTNLVRSLERAGDWNRYEIRAVGPQIELFLNGQRTAVWVESTPGIETAGLIALQIHGNCKAEIAFRAISIEELPAPAVPTEAEILSRFGAGQPAVPLEPFPAARFRLDDDETIVLVGQENLVRDQKAGELEAALLRAFAERRPKFRSMAWEADTVYEQWRDLNFGSWTAQIERAGATVVFAQFGQLEALDGAARLPEFKAAYHRLLDQFAARTRRLVLISPMPFEKPLAPDAPDLTRRNPDVALYVSAIRELASQRQAIFVDIFTPLTRRPAAAPRLTADGMHLEPTGLRELAALVLTGLGGTPGAGPVPAGLHAAIVEKNRLWFDCWRPANWSFVYGDRVAQTFAKGMGEDPSLKEAFERHRPLIAATEARIFALARGTYPQTAPPDRPPLPPALTEPAPAALTPEQQLATFTPADGYQVNLFGSEQEGVVKPTQIAWDEHGRLYVACSPTYPHTQASAPPADYVLRLEDTDGDGRADRSVRFAEGLTMVQGVEPAGGGLYVCDFDRLLHLRDTDGDGRADARRVVFSGFGIGDTHQLVNSIAHGPDGSLWFTQGLHAFSRVETPWGVARLDRAGVWRMTPRSLRLEGFFGGGMAGANCWGVAFDDFGQVFHKSGDRPHGYWTVPGMVRGASPLGSGSTTSADTSYANSPEQYHSVGPLFDTNPKTTSLDIVGTRALPEDIQGCAVIGGYFGGVIELHRFEDAGAGFKTIQLPKLLRSSSASFRPVDVSVGPDGAIYVADWFNPVIGHYQASYADPRRDKQHGRVWRIAARNRPPVRQPALAKMTPPQLLDQLRSPERWTRYHAKRLLFDGSRPDVIAAADRWVAELPATAEGNERLLIEVIGVFEAHQAARPELLNKLLRATDARVRAYGARVAGQWAEQLPDPVATLHAAAQDTHPRVRLEAVVAASYVPRADAVEVVTAALESPLDPFLEYALRQSARALQPRWAPGFQPGARPPGRTARQTEYLRRLLGTPPAVPTPGQLLYEMACLPCHQPEGRGLAGIYPPLAGSEWVQGDVERLIRIVLHGLSGPVRVLGQDYGGPGTVPMPAMGGLEDEQVAQVLTYVRNAFGNMAAAVSAAEVARVRAATATRQAPWTTTELGSAR